VVAALGLAAATATATALAPEAQAADSRFGLEFDLDTGEGAIDIQLDVVDRGDLRELRLNFGDLDRLQGEPRLDGDWTWEDGEAVADLQATPNPTASWTADGRIRVDTKEGEGHTSYVGEDFAIVRAGQMVPSLRYTFPQGSPPTFQTQLTVDAPAGWTTAGPWNRTAGAFETGTPIPRGFLVADDDLEEATLGHEEVPYRILRVEGAREANATEEILLEARDFLGGLYGQVAHQRLIVVGPSPMFRGGLASPDGVFLHADATQSTVAHEMVHAYQGWQASRAPADATIWVMEGLAEVHGTLLEVAADVLTRQEALEKFQRQHDRAREEQGVALSSVVYGSEHEQAAYDKGAVVMTALNDGIRNASSNQYTLADVLKHVNEVSAEEGRGAWGPDRFNNTDLHDAIADVTGYSFRSLFETYVHGAEVPPLGSVFPGEVSVRILGTEPDPAVAGEPLELRVALTNLDTQPNTTEAAVHVDGEQRATLEATLGAGETAEATAGLPALTEGNYTVRVLSASTELTVVGPPQPAASIDVFPPAPSSDQNVTVGLVVENDGEAPYRGPARLELDGDLVREQDEPVPAGASRTFSSTLAPLSEGGHVLQIVEGNGTVLAERALTASAPDQDPQPEDESPAQDGAPAPGLAVAVTCLAAAAGLARARQRT
jgi:hypothetical protein